MGNVSQIIVDLPENEQLKLIDENKIPAKDWYTTKFTDSFDTILLYACYNKRTKLALRVIDKYVELDHAENQKLSNGKKIKTKNYLALLGHMNTSMYVGSFSAISMACTQKLLPVISKLLEYPEYCNLKNADSTIAQFVVSNTSPNDTEFNKILHRFLDLCKENMNDNILTLYTATVINFSYEIAKKMIDHGADINHQDSDGKTFLMIIIERWKDLASSHLELLLLLLAEKTLIEKYKWDLVDKKANSLLSIACNNSHKCYKVLSDYYKKNSIKALPSQADIFNWAYDAKNVQVVKDIISEGYTLTPMDKVKLQTEPVFWDLIKDKESDPPTVVSYYINQKFEQLFKKLEDMNARLVRIESKTAQITPSYGYY